MVHKLSPFELPANREEALNLIQALRSAVENTTNADEARLLVSRIAQITRSMQVQYGVGLPTNPALQAHEFDEGYRIRPHIDFLSEKIRLAVRAVERGKNQQLVISMPPRAGKTELCSVYTPFWMLRRHPDWKIVLSSHDASLSSGWAGRVRGMIEERPDMGIALQPDGGAQGSWSTVEGGGIFSTSTRGRLIGRGAKVLIIDDPVSNFVDAHSMVMRANLWDWYLSVALSRLEPPYLVLIVMCMTGDTPVLMADGTERPLRDIRVGDEIATYENGQVTTSRVLNWANQGSDTIYEIRMKSGTSVRANARHPFLTTRDGVEQWQRTDQLVPGSKVLSVRAPGREFSATAGSRPSARVSACRATTRRAGRLAIALRRSIRSLVGMLGSSIGTASRGTSTTEWSLSGKGAATSAERFPQTVLRTGAGSSVSTMTQSLGKSAGCSATTTTSSSSSTSLLNGCALPPTTWSAIEDEVIEIVPAGVEDVFDLQVERTENFIAGGLVSHNTRWHEDDLVGRLLSPDFEGDPRSWQEIRLPAIAVEEDALGREPGEPLLSPLLNETPTDATARWLDVRTSVGSYVFSAMYQQSPAPAKGAIFDSNWWKFWTRFESNATVDGRVVYLDPETLTGGRWIDSWDMAFKSKVLEKSGWVVGQRWVRSGANRYLIAQQRGRFSFTETLRAMLQWAEKDDPRFSLGGRFVNERFIEEAANGAAVVDTLKEEITGLRTVPTGVSKEARAQVVTPECERGEVFLPYPDDPGNEWVADLLSELRNFPNDMADDQVDAFTMALIMLRVEQKGGLTIPGRTMGRPAWQSPSGSGSLSLSKGLLDRLRQDDIRGSR